MDVTLHSMLAAWGSFYVITGTAAAALIGLQFVVQTLLASNSIRPAGDPETGIAAFSTPTVVHLSLALLVSSVLSAPWPGFVSLRAALVLMATGALVYFAVVLRRARRQRSYTPVAEDWLWHFVLPGAAYVAILAAAAFLHRGAEKPLFAVAGATLLLLFVAIHNAWDTITYFVLNALRTTTDASSTTESAPEPRGDTSRRHRRRR